MAALELRAIRIYTILRPCFYAELAAYNRAHRDAPLYLVQGVWIPEEQFLAGQDLYAPAVRSGFLRERDDADTAVHGGLRRSPRRGALRSPPCTALTASSISRRKPERTAGAYRSCPAKNCSSGIQTPWTR